ncbi:helix-turn-helix transcriptional regulator [Paenibacillus sp. CF384]|uniref:helix-turn-helix domain-containing protein n=1 Tax=Paenibacillus sp. CF384 TaxID=1884382 RepID=UPI0015A6961F|nr:helix-turn-helix transcriptional regulator [Paenibacillus sp. CF384]
MNAALLEKIKHYMEINNWNYKDLSALTDIHISEISRIFNNKKHLTPSQLDKITNAIGLPAGSLYYFYIEECFSDNETIHKSRSSQFLYNCMLNGREVEANMIIECILEENSKYLRRS